MKAQEAVTPLHLCVNMQSLLEGYLNPPGPTERAFEV